MDWNRNEPMGCQLFETPIFSKLKLFKPKLFKPKLFKPQTFGTNTFQTKNLLKTPPLFRNQHSFGSGPSKHGTRYRED